MKSQNRENSSWNKEPSSRMKKQDKSMDSYSGSNSRYEDYDMSDKPRYNFEGSSQFGSGADRSQNAYSNERYEKDMSRMNYQPHQERGYKHEYGQYGQQGQYDENQSFRRGTHAQPQSSRQSTSQYNQSPGSGSMYGYGQSSYTPSYGANQSTYTPWYGSSSQTPTYGAGQFNTQQPYGRSFDHQSNDHLNGHQFGPSAYNSPSQGSSRWGSTTGEQAEGRFYGKGPKGYQRSDERLKEDVCEALYHDAGADASEVEISVEKGVVTLSGTVEERRMKRIIEECVEGVSGVTDVRNELRIQTASTQGIDSANASAAKNNSSKNSSTRQVQ